LLRFTCRPDPIFQQILEEAIELALCNLDPELVDQDDPSDFASLYPDSARCFTAPVAIRVLEELRTASRDPSAVYQLTDYHWLLLHDCLQQYCEVFNDAARFDGRRLGKTKIQEIDFDGIVDCYFWDVDFFLPAEALDRIGHERRTNLMCVSDEAYAIAHGLAPHPDELRLELLQPGCEPFMDDLPDAYREGSAKYPDFLDDE